MATNSELIARAYLSRINYLQSEVAALKSYLVLERVQKDRLAFKLSESQKKGTKAQEELAKAALKREQAINISADVIAHSKELLGYLKGYHDDNAVMKKDHNTMHAALLKALEKAGDLYVLFRITSVKMLIGTKGPMTPRLPARDPQRQPVFLHYNSRNPRKGTDTEFL
jgi:hypothetical protein